jgi:hypothetical protein
MHISDAMKNDSGAYPGNGVVGRELPAWFDVAQLQVESGALDVADRNLINSVRVAMPNGNYIVEGRLIDFGGSLCLSRLRARAEGCAVRLGESCGKVSVDLGGVAVADIQGVTRGLNSEEQEEWEQRAGGLWDVFCDGCSMNFESRVVQFVVAKSGFGDGWYPVFALKSGNDVVGLEVEFIKDGHELKNGH